MNAIFETCIITGKSKFRISINSKKYFVVAHLDVSHKSTRKVKADIRKGVWKGSLLFPYRGMCVVIWFQ